MANRVEENYGFDCELKLELKVCCNVWQQVCLAPKHSQLQMSSILFSALHYTTYYDDQ